MRFSKIIYSTCAIGIVLGLSAFADSRGRITAFRSGGSRVEVPNTGMNMTRPNAEAVRVQRYPGLVENIGAIAGQAGYYQDSNLQAAYALNPHAINLQGSVGFEPNTPLNYAVGDMGGGVDLSAYTALVTPYGSYAVNAGSNVGQDVARFAAMTRAGPHGVNFGIGPQGSVNFGPNVPAHALLMTPYGPGAVNLGPNIGQDAAGFAAMTRIGPHGVNFGLGPQGPVNFGPNVPAHVLLMTPYGPGVVNLGPNIGQDAARFAAMTRIGPRGVNFGLGPQGPVNFGPNVPLRILAFTPEGPGGVNLGPDYDQDWARLAVMIRASQRFGNIDPRLLVLKFYRDNHGDPWNLPDRPGEGFREKRVLPAPFFVFQPPWEDFTAPSGGNLGNAYTISSGPNMQVYMEALRGFAEGKGLHPDSRVGSTRLPVGMVWYFQDSHGNVYSLSGWPEEQGTIRLVRQGTGGAVYHYSYPG